MSTFIQDLKFGARLLAKTPGFTAIAALSLALGIGANTTIFTLVNAVLLNPLPVEDPSQLVSVFTTDERNTRATAARIPADLADELQGPARQERGLLPAMTGHSGIPLNITGGTRASRADFRRDRHRQLFRGARRAAG